MNLDRLALRRLHDLHRPILAINRLLLVDMLPCFAPNYFLHGRYRNFILFGESGCRPSTEGV